MGKIFLLCVITRGAVVPAYHSEDMKCQEKFKTIQSKKKTLSECQVYNNIAMCMFRSVDTTILCNNKKISPPNRLNGQLKGLTSLYTVKVATIRKGCVVAMRFHCLGNLLYKVTTIGQLEQQL